MIAALLPFVLAASLGAAAPLPGLPELKASLDQFVPTPLEVDVSGLPASERKALARLVQAARVLDPLFLRQSWAGSEAWLMTLARDTTPLGQARLRLFLLNQGPWDRLKHDATFLPGVPPKPESGNFYPAGATKDEVSRWMSTLSPADRARASGFFTTIRRTPAGGFTIVPYSLEYQGELARAAALLREAAAATAQPALKSFLEQRAAALLNDDYAPSDVAWMQLDTTIDPTFGPYETYEDEWFNQKAGFEAYITVVDPKETEKLKRFSSQLQALENALPMDDRYKNPKIGALAPIRVVNSLFASGDGNRGVQTAAYNLPNDERTVAAHGSKRIMLRNMDLAKFDQTLVPIAKIAIAPQLLKSVQFDPFFTQILMHELMHGIGPQRITVNGRETTPRAELQETYGAIEECKADVVGIWAMQRLVDQGQLPAEMGKALGPTVLAGLFRSIRFGLNEAHGKGTAVQLNWLLDAGAYKVSPDGRFTLVPEKVGPAFEALARELLTIEATGDKSRAKALLERLVVHRPETERVLSRLGKVPVDIAPRYLTAEKLEAEFP
ncbi:MAG: dipeptidyl-peptidase 3 family protein [Myxococcaceae bacterium]